MKLYDFKLAPSPRRVRVFLAEKGLEVPVVQVDLRNLGQFAADFDAINDQHMVPVLELDDGTCIAESMAICRYLEALHPEPPLFGATPVEHGIVEMWNRRVEHGCFLACADAVRNSSPRFEGRALAGFRDGMPQIPALAERGRSRVREFLKYLDAQLAKRDHVALDTFSVADITALVSVDFAFGIGIDDTSGLENLAGWYRRMSSRPSAAA